MLSIHVVREGGHTYYVRDLVPGRAEGTLVAGEDRGQWSGIASPGLGLTGTVETEPFAGVLGGREPDTGRPLRRGGGPRNVAAFDLTFGAPKTVSLLHLLAPRELAAAVGAGHAAAVDDALAYVEADSLGVRRRSDGPAVPVAAAGAVAATFAHRTSRALDPHLHTHLVVANVAQGVDGNWSTLDSRRLFGHSAAVQGVYHARLRLELTERLGVEWEVRAGGLGDVVGVDRGLVHLFSQRAAGATEHLHDRGLSGSGRRARQVAYSVTRPAKDRTVTVEALRTEWKQRAGDLGYDLGQLVRVVGLGAGRGAGLGVGSESTSPFDRDRIGVALGGFAEHGRTLRRRDVVAVLAAAAVRGTSASQLDAIATVVTSATGPATPRAKPGEAFAEPRWSASDLARVADRSPELFEVDRSGAVRHVAADIRVPHLGVDQLARIGRSHASGGAALAFGR